MCLPARTTPVKNSGNVGIIQPLIPSKNFLMKREKKSVRFNQSTLVYHCESATSKEVKQCWYDSNEMAFMRSEGREIAMLYRKEVESTNVGEKTDGYQYRGFEGTTAKRKLQRLLSNRCVLFAYQNGATESEVSDLYERCNLWSKQVAFLQAIHDFNESYSNIYDTSNVQIPSVSSLQPPPPFPFAIQSYVAMKKNDNSADSVSSTKRCIHDVTMEGDEQRRIRQRVAC